MKKIHKLILLPLLLLFAACKKDELKLLPDATQTGADTMGAIVNGKAWVADGGTGFLPPKPVEGGYLATRSFDETRNNIFITAYKKDKTSISIYLRNVTQPGEYLLNTTTKPFGGELVQPHNHGAYQVPGRLFMTNSRYTGKVSITRADTVNKIVSGIFTFKAKHGQDTVIVTNGRFDVGPF